MNLLSTVGIARALAAVCLSFVLVVGYQWRWRKHTTQAKTSEETASLLIDIDSNVESKSSATASSEDHASVWKQELFVTHVAVYFSLAGIVLLLTITSWFQWMFGTFAQCF